MEKFWKFRLGHVLFWIITVGFHIYTRIHLIEESGWEPFASEIVVRNVLLAIIIYINLEFLIPAFARRQQVVLYALGLIACFGFYILTKNLHDVYLNIQLEKSGVHFWKYSFYNFSIALFYVVFSLALELSKAWFFQREQLRKVELEKLNTELEYLKSQINPHFLFNSINTIYFQIDRQNNAAREALSKFSDMLRYQLYECNGNEIPVEKEIAYLKNYVELQRMRRDDNYSITFCADESVRNFSIAPLLMIAFVENAFKHVSTYTDRKNHIAIDLAHRENSFLLRVSNTKDTIQRAAGKGGIGLKNVRRRLDLLYYNRHELIIQEGSDNFVIDLKLTLDPAAK